MKNSFFGRGSVLAGMALAFGLAMPMIAEASSSKSRSAVERRQRPGLGYFANSPQNRSRTSTPSRAVAPPVYVSPASPGFSDSAIARTQRVQRPMTIVNGNRVYMNAGPQVVGPQEIIANCPPVMNQQQLVR